MLSALLVALAVQTSTQLPPQERENRNRLIVHYAKYQVYTALEIFKILAIVHGYVLSCSFGLVSQNYGTVRLQLGPPSRQLRVNRGTWRDETSVQQISTAIDVIKIQLTSSLYVRMSPLKIFFFAERINFIQCHERLQKYVAAHPTKIWL